jgi:hypothetical protein
MKRIGIALSLSLFSPLAHAEDAQDACVAQADHGQSLRDQGKLIQAREQFLLCARDPCATMITKQCATWLQKVDDEIPTVAFRAKGGDGKDIVDVHVLSDGKEIKASIDGQPIAIDPGVHAFLYRHAGDDDLQETVVIRAGEKNRPVDIQFASKTIEPPPPPTAPAPRRFRVPLGTWVSVGVGVSAFLGMGLLAVGAANDASHLRMTCAPTCTTSQVDGVRTTIVAANVALGVGIAALGVAALWLILANTIPSGGSSTPIKALRMDPVLRF